MEVNDYDLLGELDKELWKSRNDLHTMAAYAPDDPHCDALGIECLVQFDVLETLRLLGGMIDKVVKDKMRRESNDAPAVEDGQVKFLICL